ncbi:type II secretion system minor pseudopilin GspK [Duganella violaceipulchra]|uniref:Type II secretion system protein K n=1 Tax=Duganella violaceipulchra TaxID=2849652 RepID=A0AA41H7H8_9BURK|nr:type II secretion system minor pseudopilin GspK [Duganella violaceicalia]MBV6319504.1 type II secretion system minor pseudopilin GspK [Duganella violaceicalia]MCP2006684.1 general secretion pathway protein K [Duganella violaceicalia]
MALVTALLITTLAVSAVANLFWRQQVQVRMLENQRLHLQTQWVQRAGLDWSRQILRDDGERSPDLTTLDGAWNTQPAAIRLDRFFDREPGEQAGTPASIASRLVDAQSRYNLANLASGRALNLAEIGIYERLLTNLRLDPALALRTAQTLAASQTGEGGGRRHAALRRVDELSSVQGYTPPVLAALADFIVLLPAPADLNLDAAAPELLAAVTRLPLPQARQLADRRRQAYFRSMAELRAMLPDSAVLDGVRIGLRSDYFLVENKIRLEHAELDAVSLLYRPRGNAAAIELVWTREE